VYRLFGQEIFTKMLLRFFRHKLNRCVLKYEENHNINCSNFSSFIYTCFFFTDGISDCRKPIYIRADGSVEGTDKIQRDGDVYTLISDISGSIVVERENVVFP